MISDVEPIPSWALAALRQEMPATDRDLWVDTARVLFHPGEREPCCVCHGFRSIAQAHHVVPLAMQYDRGFRTPDGEFEWLCPNHHVMVHLFILDDDRTMSDRAVKERHATIAALNPDLDNAQFEALLSLSRRAGRGPA